MTAKKYPPALPSLEALILIAQCPDEAFVVAATQVKVGNEGRQAWVHGSQCLFHWGMRLLGNANADESKTAWMLRGDRSVIVQALSEVYGKVERVHAVHTEKDGRYQQCDICCVERWSDRRNRIYGSKRNANRESWLWRTRQNRTTP